MEASKKQRREKRIEIRIEIFGENYKKNNYASKNKIIKIR